MRDEKERRAFLENLVSAISPENAGRLTIVITLRADFYDECGRYPRLRTLLQDNQEYIGPMSSAELRSAIEEPARLGNWEFERGLVDLILRDVGEEPGALPLLSHALLETWNHRRGRMMTLESYAQAGGVHGAIVQTAETVFHKRLNANQQVIARGLFLRMTELGEGTQDTRRRVTLNELITESGKQAEIESVLAALVDARLVTTSEDSAEVAHEALIREWPLLRTWLSEDRETLRLAVGVRGAAREWQQAEKDASLLIHRGARLEEALALIENARFPFNPQETEYLRACQKLVEGERRARERLRNRLLSSAVAVALVMLLLGIWGLNRAREADRQLRIAEVNGTEAALQAGNAQSQAATAMAERDRAENMTLIARTRQLAAEAVNTLDEFPERSLLLSIEALRYTNPRLPQAEEILRAGVANIGGRGLVGHQGFINTLAFSPDGRWLVTGSGDATARLWDMQNPNGEPMVLPGNQGRINDLAFSPDGRWLATGNEDATARLWDMQNPNGEPVVLRGHEDTIYNLAFSPDGRWLATGSQDATARLWNMQNLDIEPVVLRGHEDTINDLAFSPDGRWLATGGWDRTARLWDMQNPDVEPVVLRGHEDTIIDLAFSPDGYWLATRIWNNTTRLWDIQNPNSEPVVLRGHEREVTALAFSPDRHWLATASVDRTARLWDLQNPNGEPVVLRGHEDTIWSLAFSLDGRWLATGSQDATARVWDLQNPDGEPVVLRGHEDAIWSLAFSPDGRWLATGSKDATARLWDIQNPDSEPVVLRGHQSWIYSLSFSLDGRWLATGSWDHTARLWDMDLDRLIEKACLRAGRNLSKVEWAQYFPGEEYRLTCPQFAAGQ